MVVFSLVGLILYWPVLDGAFISDDLHYVHDNPYVSELSLGNLLAIWDPTSDVTVLVQNYAPVHVTLHALEWQAFGAGVTGYHVVNVLFHALAAVLLVAVFRRSGIAPLAACLGGLLFLVHPANVEAVAWISQLKSSSALALSLGALLLHPRRPILAALLYALALLAKPFAAFAVVVAASFSWVRAGDAHEESAGEEGEDFAWRWLLLWLGITLLFGAAEALAFGRSGPGETPPLYADLATRTLSMFGIALRYLGMTVSGWGVSVFHEPPPVESLLDPLFLVASFVLGGIGWRLVHCLRKRREEAVYWVWALVGFAPLSGVIPLPYPMADRYLYFVMPGLIGAGLLLFRDVAPKVRDRFARLGIPPSVVQRTAVGCALLLALHFAVASHARAPVFGSSERLMADAERNYPDGAASTLRKAIRAAGEGRFEDAVALLRRARERGYDALDELIYHPSFARIQGYPAFEQIKREMAREWLARLGGDPDPSQLEAQGLAVVYIALEDYESALRVLEAGAKKPGPITDELETAAEALRRDLAHGR